MKKVIHYILKKLYRTHQSRPLTVLGLRCVYYFIVVCNVYLFIYSGYRTLVTLYLRLPWVIRLPFETLVIIALGTFYFMPTLLFLCYLCQFVSTNYILLLSYSIAVIVKLISKGFVLWLIWSICRWLIQKWAPK